MRRLSDWLQARDCTCRSFSITPICSVRGDEWNECAEGGSPVASSARGTVRSATNPKMLFVHTDTDWAADELTRKSVSCTVERYGSHVLDCSVAKHSLVALSSGEAEFYGIVRAVAKSKQTSQVLEQIGLQAEVTIASESSAARGICTITGSGNVRHLSIKELCIQESCRKKEFQLVPVDTLLNWADIGTKAHTSQLL